MNGVIELTTYIYDDIKGEILVDGNGAKRVYIYDGPKNDYKPTFIIPNRNAVVAFRNYLNDLLDSELVEE